MSIRKMTLKQTIDYLSAQNQELKREYDKSQMMCEKISHEHQETCELNSDLQIKIKRMDIQCKEYEESIRSLTMENRIESFFVMASGMLSTAAMICFIYKVIHG